MREPSRHRPARIAVLASGGGSNLEALFVHLDSLGAQGGGSVVLVASDRARAGALDRARARGVDAAHIVEPADGPAIDALLERHDIDLIALAGYLKLVPPAVTRRFRGRIVNVHPTLLPAFGGPGMYGVRAHRAAIDAGVRVSGATAHFVDDVYDRGAIIAQWPVPVLPNDTAESLAARVLRVEHLLYPRVVDAVARGAVTLGGDGTVSIHAQRTPPDSMFALTTNEAGSVALSIDSALG